MRCLKKILAITLVFLSCFTLFPYNAMAASSPGISVKKIEIKSAKTNAVITVEVSNPQKKSVSDIGIEVNYTTDNYCRTATKTNKVCYKADSKITVVFDFKKDLSTALRPSTGYDIVVSAKINGKSYTAKSGFTSATLFDQINSKEVFFKQGSSVTCTLAASTMMLRRKAIILNQIDWENITEANVKKVAWGTKGLNYTFTYSKIKVATASVKGKTATEKIKLFQDLLSTHQEGIVIYDHDLPHAVLLTDYNSKTGVFYAADSGLSRSNSRGVLTSTILNVGGKETQEKILGDIEQYWYCP